MDMFGFLYILKDKKGRFYIGSTNDLERRNKQHQNKHTFTTRRMDNPKIVLSQKYETLDQARVIERKLKKLKRKDYIEKIVRDGYIRIKP